HAIDHRKPRDCRAKDLRERERSAGILARISRELNPPYAGCRVAAGSGYRVGVARDGKVPLLIVVPANAGTHTPRPVSGHTGRDQLDNFSLWLWVPAFQAV